MATDDAEGSQFLCKIQDIDYQPLQNRFLNKQGHESAKRDIYIEYCTGRTVFYRNFVLHLLKNMKHRLKQMQYRFAVIHETSIHAKKIMRGIRYITKKSFIYIDIYKAISKDREKKKGRFREKRNTDS